MTKQGSGLELCEQAFERLKAGNPHNSKHVGLNPSDISPAVVSVEAGFDKGYLKGSRAPHKPLIALIADFAGGAVDESKKQIGELSRKLEKTKSESSEQALVLTRVLSQNLMLIERVRELEAELQRKGGQTTIKWPGHS